MKYIIWILFSLSLILHSRFLEVTSTSSTPNKSPQSTEDETNNIFNKKIYFSELVSRNKQCKPSEHSTFETNSRDEAIGNGINTKDIKITSQKPVKVVSDNNQFVNKQAQPNVRSDLPGDSVTVIASDLKEEKQHFDHQTKDETIPENNEDVKTESVPSMDGSQEKNVEKVLDKDSENMEVENKSETLDQVDNDKQEEQKEKEPELNQTKEHQKKENVADKDMGSNQETVVVEQTEEGNQEIRKDESRDVTSKPEEDSNQQETKDPRSEEKPTDEPVKLEVDTIQSFEEWKQKQLQDREEAAANVDTNATPQRTIRTKKTQVNYASQDCGAKILAHNQESKHVSAILDENKDMYMLNPCSANIWFVVELCEPIQIRQLQLANFELFSSAPKLFEVSISERYPAREWQKLGTFEARNDRSLQTFAPNKEDLLFAKYIKFEMKSHFGNEHFCPLTIIRVLGMSMVDEYEEAVEKDKDTTLEGKESTLKSSEQIENPKTEDAQEDREKQRGSFGKMINIVKNAVDNLLGGAVENNDLQNSTSETNSTMVVNQTQDEEVIDPSWESPVTLVTNRSEVERSSSENDTPIVRLVATGDGQEVFLAEEKWKPPFVDLSFLSKFSSKDFGTRMCWFFEFVYRVSIISCIIQPHSNSTSASGSFFNLPRFKNATSTIPKSSSLSEDLSLNSPPVDKPPVDPAPKSEARTDEEFKEKDKVNFVLENKSEAEDNLSKQLLEAKKIVDKVKSITEEVLKQDKANPGSVLRAECTTETKEKKPAQENNNNNNIKEKPGTVTKTDTNETIKESREITDSNNMKPLQPVENVKTGDVDEIPATSSEDSTSVESKYKVKNSQDVLSDQSSQSESKASIDNEPDAKDTKSDQEDQTPSLAPQVNVPATAIPPLDGSKATKEEEKEELIEDQVVINPGTNQKESVLMRLNNRIRALERNMSLSSDYLEDLSQRYRRQMDEMQKAFNRTKAKLLEASRKAEENEQRQTEAIVTAQNETAILSKRVAQMDASMEYLNQQMVARHLCLMALESVILIVITVTCFVTRQTKLAKRVEKAERLVRDLCKKHEQELLENKKFRTNRSLGVVKKKKSNKSSPAHENLQRRFSLPEPESIPSSSSSSRSSSNASNRSSPPLVGKRSFKSSSGFHKKRSIPYQGGKNRKNFLPQEEKGSSSTGLLTSEMIPKKQERRPDPASFCGARSIPSSDCVPKFSAPICRHGNVPWGAASAVLPSALSGKAR